MFSWVSSGLQSESATFVCFPRVEHPKLVVLLHSYLMSRLRIELGEINLKRFAFIPDAIFCSLSLLEDDGIEEKLFWKDKTQTLPIKADKKVTLNTTFVVELHLAEKQKNYRLKIELHDR